MTKKRTRVSAIIIVVLFFVSAFATSIFAIFSLTQKNNSNSSTNTSTVCQDVAIETPLPTPVAYQPNGTVTKLQITDLSSGTGPAVKAGDCLVVKYYGTLANSGVLFDENFDKTTGFAFRLGKDQVIPGWVEGLGGMKVGGTRRLVIPSVLAYGPAGYCKTPDPTNPQKCATYSIPPNADLVFVVKLLRLQ